jgi:hypothetical protein
MRENVLSDVYGWPVSVFRDESSSTPRVSPLRAKRTV